MKSYGIKKISKSYTKQDLHLEEFYNLGYTIIEDVLEEETLQILRDELDLIYQTQLNQIGLDNLIIIQEENLVRAPFVHSNAFAALVTHREMMEYVKKILGDFFILHLQNGIINTPNEEHHQSSWHRDLPYQNWTSSEPLACNVYFCLDDFNSTTGSTHVLPFSHHMSTVPSSHYFQKNSTQVQAKKGSVILFNSMIFHKAGYNSSLFDIRRGINHVYTKPFISQQMNIPEMLGGKFSEDFFTSMVFGYKTKLAHSVFDYRSNRLKNIRS